MSEESSQLKRPSVYDYDNFREFLRDFYRWSKSIDKKFSFRFFARATGFSSSAMLKRIIDGDRNLSLEAIGKFAKALKLNPEETRFFRNLSLLNQAKSHDERMLYAEQLMHTRSFKDVRPLEPFQHDYFKHWYFIAIKELAALPEFKEDVEWIAKALAPAITVAEAKKALEGLQSLGLLKRDPATGRLFPTDLVLDTGPLTSPALAQFHRNMIKFAGESIERFKRNERLVTSVSLPLAPEAFEKTQEIIARFRQEIVELGNQYPGHSRVYQMNFQLFPLTQDLKKKDGK